MYVGDRAIVLEYKLITASTLMDATAGPQFILMYVKTQIYIHTYILYVIYVSYFGPKLLFSHISYTIMAKDRKILQVKLSM